MVNKREKTRSLLYQMKEDLFHREAALFDSEDTISGDLQPCFAHRLTGTFYDKPDTILDAARLLEIRGEQIDRENSVTMASNNTATAAVSTISKILGNQDLPLLKSRRNRMTQGRVQRTDVDSSTTPPGSQIQQLFRDKMEGLELRGWTAAIGTEVKLDSEYISSNDPVDSIGDWMTDEADKTICASDGDIEGQKTLKKPVLIEYEDQLEQKSLKKNTVQKSCVQKSASKSKQPRQVGDVDAHSLDVRCSSDSALNALDLTPVTTEKTQQQLLSSESSDGQVEVGKHDCVRSDEGGHSRTTGKDSCVTKKNLNSSSTIEHEHMTETCELRNEGSKSKTKDTREAKKNHNSTSTKVCNDTTESDKLHNGSLTLTGKDTCELKKDRNINCTRLLKDMTKTDKLHKDSSKGKSKDTGEPKKGSNTNSATDIAEVHSGNSKSKVRNTPVLNQSEVAGRRSQMNETPEISKVHNSSSSTKLNSTAESLRSRTISSSSKVKKVVEAKTSDNVSSTNIVVNDSSTNSDSLEPTVLDTDKSNSVTISRSGLKSTTNRACCVSGSNESVGRTLVEVSKGDAVVLQNSHIVTESDDDRNISSHTNICSKTSQPPGAPEETTVESILTSSEEKQKVKEFNKGESGSSTNIISETSSENVCSSFEVASSDATKLDVTVDRKHRLSRSLKRRSVVTHGVSSDEYSTDSSQTVDKGMCDEKLICLLESKSVSSEVNQKNLKLENSKCGSLTSNLSEKCSTNLSSSFEVAASGATKVDASMDRKQRFSRSVRCNSFAAGRASSNESQTADRIALSEKSQLLLELHGKIEAKTNEKVMVVTEVASTNESASEVQQNLSTDCKLIGDMITTVNDNDEQHSSEVYCAVKQADKKKKFVKKLEELDAVHVAEEVCDDKEKESSSSVETILTSNIVIEKPNVAEALSNDADVNCSLTGTGRRLRPSRKQDVSKVGRLSSKLALDKKNEVAKRIPVEKEYLCLDKAASQCGTLMSCSENYRVLDETVNTDLDENECIETNAHDNTGTTEHQVLKSREYDSAANCLESSYVYKQKPKDSNIEFIFQDMSVHNVDLCSNENFMSVSNSNVAESCVRLEVTVEDEDKSPDIKLHKESAASSISPMEDINSDSCEQFCLEIETEGSEASDIRQTSVAAASNLCAHLDDVKIKQEECKTFVSPEASKSKVSLTSSRHRLEGITDRGKNRKIGAKRRRSSREDNTKIASGTYQFAPTNEPKSEVDIGLCDVSNVFKDQKFCYNVKAENGFKPDVFDTKTVATSAIHTDSRLATDSRLHKFDDDSLDTSFAQKEVIVGQNNVDLVAVDQWLSTASGIPSSCDPSTWTRRPRESVTRFNDGISSHAGNPAVIIREPLSSHFNRSISVPFNSSMSVDPKSSVCKSPVVKVISESRRDQIRADLIRRFMPNQLVVADSIKQRVIEGLGQIAFAARQSRPVFCCHSRQKMITRPRFRKQEVHTGRSSSVSSTSRRRPSVSSGCDSPSSRRVLPERHRRKTYLQMDYISGDELTSPLKNGCISSDGDTVNLENDSDFTFSDDDDDFIPNSRTSIKRRRRRSTLVR